eukprot:CAMPEP_0197849980 /NCGR_PEP_ID=MMETSP1438-20131217/13838_1 /TAXON_ID=1461541 /ORGANISM="Pterosperma sp., Strain CCMP1384" /LENGTH=188 /DNA_ID=CAMNT_0043462909 /DNA_START=330 /DNA_END=892 /DNA_ORIENTATION=+
MAKAMRQCLVLLFVLQNFLGHAGAAENILCATGGDGSEGGRGAFIGLGSDQVHVVVPRGDEMWTLVDEVPPDPADTEPPTPFRHLLGDPFKKGLSGIKKAHDELADLEAMEHVEKAVKKAKDLEVEDMEKIANKGAGTDPKEMAHKVKDGVKNKVDDSRNAIKDNIPDGINEKAKDLRDKGKDLVNGR